jgi:hypothetical protein
MNEKTVYIIFVLLLIFLFGSKVSSQYTLKSSVLGNGYGIMSGNNNTISSTVGQTFIGRTVSGSNINQVGFWYYVNLITAIPWEDNLLPKEFELLQNYPNPFNPITRIRFAVPKSSHVLVEVYNVLGQRVSTLVNEEKQPGYYIVNFNASSLASGFYIYRLEANGFKAVKKMIVTK